jgi:hypothetical protein
VTYLWSFVDSVVVDTLPDVVSGRRVLALFVIGLVAVAVVTPARLRVGVASIVTAAIVAATAVGWRDSVRTSRDFEALLPTSRAWVDGALDDGRSVTALYVSAECGWAPRTATGLLLTEFYNAAVGRAAHLAEPDGSLLPSSPVALTGEGAIVTAVGEPGSRPAPSYRWCSGRSKARYDWPAHERSGSYSAQSARPSACRRSRDSPLPSRG